MPSVYRLFKLNNCISHIKKYILTVFLNDCIILLYDYILNFIIDSENNIIKVKWYVTAFENKLYVVFSCWGFDH